MTAKEAASVFHIRTYQTRSLAPVGQQSYCSYLVDHEGVLETNVSWFKKEVTTFTQEHSPFTVSVAGKTPSGATIPAPTFTTYTVDVVQRIGWFTCQPRARFPLATSVPPATK